MGHFYLVVVRGFSYGYNVCADNRVFLVVDCCMQLLIFGMLMPVPWKEVELYSFVEVESNVFYCCSGSGSTDKYKVQGVGYFLLPSGR